MEAPMQTLADIKKKQVGFVYNAAEADKDPARSNYGHLKTNGDTSEVFTVELLADVNYQLTAWCELLSGGNSTIPKA